MESGSKILVLGARGLVGSAIVRALKRSGHQGKIFAPSRDVLNLMYYQSVVSYFDDVKPDYVFIAAAKVGGIEANRSQKASFLHENLTIQNNIFEACLKYNVKKVLFLGSSCIYPKLSEQPIKEEYLMTGALEPSNDAYAIAKIAGIYACQAYRQQHGLNAISLMPTNIYGINDNFHLTNSHVLPALMRKFDDAKRNGDTELELWGDGTPMREFLHSDDLGDACVHMMKNYDGEEHVNIGTGKDVTIKELAETIKKVVGWDGEIKWNGKLNGTPRKLLDVSKAKSLGWEYSVELEDGLKTTYEWYQKRREANAKIKGVD